MKKHFRYNAMNSWNRSISYANNIKPSGYKSYCTHCGQKNYQAVAEGEVGIYGRCDSKTRVDFKQTHMQVFTWPILVYNFSILSIVAPLSNILVLWTLPFIIISGILAIIISYLIPALSLVWFLPLKLFIDFIIFITNVLSAIPYNYIELRSPRFIWLVFYYLILVILIRQIRKKE